MSNRETVTALPEWQDLETHQNDIADIHIADLFREDKTRFDDFHICLDDLLFDFSKHRITRETLKKFSALVNACDLTGWTKRMLGGEAINDTENRAVLHMALRGSTASDLVVDGENVADFVSDTLNKIEKLSNDIRSNPDITDIIHIGIGGSDLGLRTLNKALHPLLDGPKIHFISNIDGSTLDEQCLHSLTPKNTLVIITTKSFTTLETIENAKTAKKWLKASIPQDQLSQHFIACTSNDKAAIEFGVPEDHILPLRDWIGGRFSLWGSVGISLAIAGGFELFKNLLEGARAADQHFINTPPEKNIPVMMAMLGVWYRNFWDYAAHTVLPYSHDFRDLPKYLQQMDMESNGKSVNRNGQFLDHETGAVLFGEAGTNAQHAFMQLLHQGHTIIPVDFVIVKEHYHDLDSHHKQLLANALAQSKALMEGKTVGDDPHRNFAGNRPSSTIMLPKLDAKYAGMLLALYEHKVFVQGVIWGINSFDQFGVELGKTIAKDVHSALSEPKTAKDFDSSTEGLLRFLEKNS